MHTIILSLIAQMSLSSGVSRTSTVYVGECTKILFFKRNHLTPPFAFDLADLSRSTRSYLREELSWNVAKVDELLQPIIHKMNKRGQVSAIFS